MNNNTRDIAKFGYREKEIAVKLLQAEGNSDKWEGENGLTDGVAIEFNPSSGNVFLVDEDCNVAMMNDAGKLEMFVSCANCGAEGFVSEDDNLSTIAEEGECVDCLAKKDEVKK